MTLAVSMAVENDLLLRALRCEATERTPVWFMRQAGRSLPGYREIRRQFSLYQVCRRPDLCAEVTVEPVRRLGVDAAILFADIMHPLVAIGIDLDIVEGVGPVIAEPIRTSGGVGRLRPLEETDMDFVTEDIARVLDLLDGSVPLLGFSGAPFTLASYLVEGRPSRDFLQTKLLMYTAPEVWDALMTRLTSIVSAYLHGQVKAGVHALQLFDSWVGSLSLDDYLRYVQPYTRQVFESLRDVDIPLIHFGTGTTALLGAMRDAGGTCIGLDWRVPLDVGWNVVGLDRSVQGNIDPLVLLGSWDVIQREAASILKRAGGRAGHVFNVGHGINPKTDPDMLARLVSFVHAYPHDAAA